jgi:hypothetical protein
MAGHVAHMEKKKAYRMLVRKSEGVIPSDRPRHRLWNNIKMDIREIGWVGMNWISLAQGRAHLARANTNLGDPQIIWKFCCI